MNVNLDTKQFNAKLYLCKPNREVIYPLNKIDNVRIPVVIGEVPSLSFSFHSTVLQNNAFIKNPLLEKLKGHYLVKLVMDGKISYFTIVRQSKSFSDSEEIVNIQCYLEAYDLSKRYVRGIEETSKSIRYIANILLEETNWGIDFIDTDIESLHRSFEVSNGTILQSLFDLADKFNAIIEFDSNERNISFKKYENIGLNKGVKFKEGTFLESFNLEINDEDIVTRIVAYGENGLEFRSLTPNGVNYLQDFSWFMYPFECDENYNVLKSSNYMSDELCVALIKYNRLLDGIGNQFELLKTSRVNKQSEINLKKQEISDLEADLQRIQTAIDILNATYQDEAESQPEHEELLIRLAEKQFQIGEVNYQLSTLQNELTLISEQITNLQISISTTQNFTNEELNELSKFIREVEYTNDSIIDAQDLLDETKLVFEEYKQPPLALSLSIEAFANYFDTTLIKKLSLGDTIRLQSKTLNVDVTARIKAFDYDLSNHSVTLTIENVKSSLDADVMLAKSINNAINTSNTVNLDKYKWREGQNANTLVQSILNGVFDTSKNVLLGGTNNSVTIGSRGLYNQDISDPNTYMVINNGILAITPDGGNTVTVAIDKNGIHSKLLVGNIVLSNQLMVESESGILESNGATTTISDNLGQKKIELGEYVDPIRPSIKKYGLRIYDGAIDIRTSESENRGIQLDANGFRSFNNNGVRTFDVDATGQVSIVGSLNIKTSASTNRGVAFTGEGISAYNSSGTRTFYVDTNGNLTATSVTITGVANITGGSISGDLAITGTLTGGIVRGGNITGGFISESTIQTVSQTDRGIKINSAGIQGFNASGVVTFDVNSNGQLTATNANITGILHATGGSINGNLTVTGSLTGGVISGAVISGATINSANINITQDVRIGNNLYLGDDQSTGITKTLFFNQSANISGGDGFIGADITINSNGLNLDATQINIPVETINSGYVKSLTDGLTITRSTSTPNILTVSINGSVIGMLTLTT